MRLLHSWSLSIAGCALAGAVELRNSLTSQLGVELGSTVTFDYPTVPALARHIGSLLPHGDQATAGGAPAASPYPPSPIITIEDLRYAPATCRSCPAIDSSAKRLLLSGCRPKKTNGVKPSMLESKARAGLQVNWLTQHISFAVELSYPESLSAPPSMSRAAHIAVYCYWQLPPESSMQYPDCPGCMP